MVGLYYLTIEKDKIDEFRKEYDTKIFPDDLDCINVSWEYGIKDDLMDCCDIELEGTTPGNYGYFDSDSSYATGNVYEQNINWDAMKKLIEEGFHNPTSADIETDYTDMGYVNITSLWYGEKWRRG